MKRPGCRVLVGLVAAIGAACTSAPISSPSGNPGPTAPSASSSVSTAPSPTTAASASATSSADATATTSLTPPPLTAPALEYVGFEAYSTADGRYTRFSMRVTNWSDYADGLFEPAPDLEPCGLNVNSSRTWVEIADAETGRPLYGYCGLTAAREMENLSFALASGQLAPGAIIVTLTDRRTAQTGRSAPLSIPLGHGFSIDWQEHQPNFGPESAVFGSAVIDNRIVVIGLTYGNEASDRPRIWWEDGDLVWRPAELPGAGNNARLSAIVAGGPGLIVLGSTDFGARGLLWASMDGKHWQALDASGLDGNLWSASAVPIGVADDGLIALGRDGEADGNTVALVSTDGRSWRLSTDETTQRIAIGSYGLAGTGEELTAFTKRVDADACNGMTGGICTVGPVQVWRSSGTESWTMAAELPDSTDAAVLGAAVGPRGWVAIGDGIAWFSADGSQWHRAEGATQMPASIERVTIFGTTAGFVAVGDYYVDQCAIDGGYKNTVTWTSSDGRVWRVSDTIGQAHLTSLRRRGDTLIALGTISQLGGAYGAAWTAGLPGVSSDGDPPDPPTPLPTSEVCG